MNQAAYHCWLQPLHKDHAVRNSDAKWFGNIVVSQRSAILQNAISELIRACTSYIGEAPLITEFPEQPHHIVLGTLESNSYINQLVDETDVELLQEDGYLIRTKITPNGGTIVLAGKTDQGTLYGVFALLRKLQMNCDLNNLDEIENPKNKLRMINHWDNFDGSIERGYAGLSIFYKNNRFTEDLSRIQDYARLLASVGINAIAINNVNVHQHETNFITEQYLPSVAKVADIFRAYGIKTFLSINYASPIQIGGLATADPLDADVKQWWKTKVQEIYRFIPDFGGFLVKADSEHRPGPFTYNRNHAEGANVLAEALQPYGGLVIWRCFVYNCHQDWRDRSTDRARAAYDHFKPLDGQFMDNVVLQIKNGPMDFQVREPVSPLFGAMPKTNQMLELQITQEYTGQQKHLCYLVPQWKEVLEFNTYAASESCPVKQIVDGSVYSYTYSGMAAVSNIGDELTWTGHPLAQANLYGFGRLAWNPDLTSEDITDEWVRLTFGNHAKVVDTITKMLLSSWEIYENYTAPLGVGWMVNPGHHYGPNVDGYEYSVWGTYHFADCFGIGVDRTMKTGTGYVGQYHPKNAERYESVTECPDELLLFFHHVPYTHRLQSGKTVIQHIYDTHFEGVEQAQGLLEQWMELSDFVDEERFQEVKNRLQIQVAHTKEWRDVINTYFYRKSGINDEHNRTIY